MHLRVSLIHPSLTKVSCIINSIPAEFQKNSRNALRRKKWIWGVVFCFFAEKILRLPVYFNVGHKPGAYLQELHLEIKERGIHSVVGLLVLSNYIFE